MNLTTVKSSPSEINTNPPNFGLLVAAGVVLGMAFAGFFDGIVIHQVLQWHHMVTSIRPITNLANLEANTFWDGVFHLGTFALAIVGLGLLWRAMRQAKVASSRPFIGALLIGAGSFNWIEGLVDHHLLGIHHVKPGINQLAWDLGFLAVSGGLAIAGWIVLASYRHQKQ